MTAQGEGNLFGCGADVENERGIVGDNLRNGLGNQRLAIGGQFTPRAVRQLEDHIRSIVDGLIDKVVRLCVNCHSCVNAPTQFAGIAALEGPQDAVDEMMAAFDGRRREIVPLLNRLPGFECRDPGGAFYAFPNISGTGMDAKTLQTRLLEEAGIATVAGPSFGVHGGDYIRFSYANSVENIRRAVERIVPLLS